MLSKVKGRPFKTICVVVVIIGNPTIAVLGFVSLNFSCYINSIFSLQQNNAVCECSFNTHTASCVPGLVLGALNNDTFN
jgi:hypothetical protein